MTRRTPRQRSTSWTALDALPGWPMLLLLLVALVCVTRTAAAQAGDELDDEPSTAEPASGTDSRDDAAPEPAPPPTAKVQSTPKPTVAVRPFVGAGWSTRSFVRPADQGAQSLPATFVPAVEAGLSFVAWPADDFSFAVTLHYQTALGLTITETPPFALANDVSVRSERVALTAAPSWRFGDAAHAPRLSLPFGGAVRTFWPNVHTLMTPGYSLVGPQLGVGLLMFLGGPLSLRVGPEVQWIIMIDQSLRDSGVRSQGMALGGELLLSLELSPTWSLAAHYRESHAFASTIGSVAFQDIERYMTLRVSGTF